MKSRGVESSRMVTMGWIAPAMISDVNTLSSAPKSIGDVMSTRVIMIDNSTETIQIFNEYSSLLNCEEAKMATSRSKRNPMGIIPFSSVTSTVNWI